MLLGLLLPDPCDEHCPEAFKATARQALQGLLGVREGDVGLRRALLTFIGDVANWDVAHHPRWMGVARELVQAAHGDDPPLVVDPFAGGGSIPLEALRLGCDPFASDLNPVACLVLKIMLEEIPRYGPELAVALRQVGAEVKKATERELAEFYPPDPDGARPIAYIWARTVHCEAPNCGAEIPLVRAFWLCKRANQKWALRYKVWRPTGEYPRVEFEIFEPKSDRDVPAGTVSRAKATCLCCHTVLAPDRVRRQLREQRGGADVVFDDRGNRIAGARLLAVVTLKSGEHGRHYRLPTEHDYEVIWRAKKRFEEVIEKPLPNGLRLIPDEPTPTGGGSGASRAFSVQKYGMSTFGDLFTVRQKLALGTLCNTITSIATKDVVAHEVASLALSRFSDISNALCQWENTKTQVRHLFTRQALPMLWDFAEPSLFGEQAVDYTVTLGTMTRVIQALPHNGSVGQVQLADACASPLPDEVASVWFTDPPYYDAVPYADLSDFFFVWLKRVLPNHPLLHDPFDPDNLLTPKVREIVQDEIKTINGRPKDRAFFEAAMATAFTEGRRILREDGIGCVVFAHKTTEGWEALLSGMIRGGWVLTGSWPIATESGTRLRARDSAALATSVHLICRPRSEEASIGDWGEVLHELPRRISDWMERLQQESVRGADLVFACIGPALELFSRYEKVETPDGREVKLPEFLEKVWGVLGRVALEQILGTAEATARNGAAGAMEEDARLTALFLWTLQSTNIEATNNGDDASEEDVAEEGDEEDVVPPLKQGSFSLIFDIVRRFAQPLGIHLEQWEGRIIETKKGVVRLLPVVERARQLFGKEGAQAVADLWERHPERTAQLHLFADAEEALDNSKGSGRGSRKRSGIIIAQETFTARREMTTLDRVHIAMLFQASGQTNALRALLAAEQERGVSFLRLANALSALYPRTSEEKRLLDAMLLAIPKT
jgi:adenine-specific DNA methylase